ncbi:MAG: septum formation protein Maf [Phycisphaerae bacterium]|nr:septum formation protein Maf [Phycisphaerae bacterium]
MSLDNSNSKTAPRLILASASPRRAQLLRDHGFSFDMVVPPFEEPVALPGVDDPVELARRLSVLKAESARGVVQRGVILAGDTIAALGHRVFGKAENRDDARRILTAITAATHRVITAVTLLDAESGRSRTEHAVTEVTMRALSEQEMQEYLDSGAWIGKAGAYGIQDHGDRFVTRLDGSFSNVVGLPVEIVVEMLAEWGIRPAEHP